MARPFASCAKAGDVQPSHPRPPYESASTAQRKPLEKLRYIHENPVKRGLVEKPQDRRWSSFRRYSKVWWRLSRNGQRKSEGAWGSIRQFGGGNQHEFPGLRSERERPHPPEEYVAPTKLELGQRISRCNGLQALKLRGLSSGVGFVLLKA